MIEPVCKDCGDTHKMPSTGFLCTYCPVPCQRCRQGGSGPYCENTPCSCDCHKDRYGATKPEDVYARLAETRSERDQLAKVLDAATDTANKCADALELMEKDAETLELLRKIQQHACIGVLIEELAAARSSVEGCCAAHEPIAEIYGLLLDLLNREIQR